ncbi:hypothetical protein DVW12_09810 [Clostridium botulinum]|nr:hypothetical protein [Clostridium botulinum]
MTKCNGTTPSPVQSNCYSGSVPPVISKINCGCIPCETPVIVKQGDVSTQVLVPVLAEVIQNCMCIDRYETSYPNNWVIQTDLLKAPTTGAAPSGNICIKNVSYSYNCIGVSSSTINAFVDSNSVVLSSAVASCSCGTTPTNLYNKFTGSAKTAACCCDQVAQPYSQAKIVEKNVPFSICNLKISVTGTIGNQSFTGTLVGTTALPVVQPITPTAFLNPTPIQALTFPQYVNFAGRMCLPTSKKLNISEEFDSCLIVDCIRPTNSTYSVAEDPTTDPTTPADSTSIYANFIATSDLSLVINKNIYATTNEKLAVMTNSGAQIVCNDGNLSIPDCPSTTPCTPQCPPPVQRPSD